MSSTKKTFEEKISYKIKRVSKAMPTKSTSKKLEKAKITARPKNPEISVVNLIEQISLLLRKEAQKQEQKKAS